MKVLISAVLLTISMTFVQRQANAQNSSVAIGDATPKSNAVLYLKSPGGNQGLIIPIVSTPGGFGEAGMVVYGSVDKKVFYHDGTGWFPIGTGSGGGSTYTLSLSGNNLLLRDASSTVSTVPIAATAPTAANQLLMWDGAKWIATTFSQDAANANGVITVNGIKGKTLPALPSSTQALVYNGTAWVFQALTGGTDSQDLTLNATTNILSLQNDATTVDLSAYKQTLSASGTGTAANGESFPVALSSSGGTVTIKEGSNVQIDQAANVLTINSVAGGSGTVTTVSVAPANGVSGTVTNPTTTPAITVSLGAITPTSVAATGTVTGTNISGTNTGDNAVNTLYSGLVSNATHTGDATGATALLVRGINGVLLSGLGTGILKNTTGTGVPSIATGADLPVMTSTVGGAVPTPPNNTTTFLRGDGTFATPVGGGGGTVTTVSVATANGVSGTVTNPTTTPAITVSLGAITPTSVASTGTVTGTNISGTNTGDNAVNTLYSGLVSNATHTGDATGATALLVRGINGVLLSGLGTGILKNTTGTGVPSIATGADLPVMTSTVGGAVPTPPNNTTTFLRGDGTFATPAGGGTLTAVSVTTANGFSGTSSGGSTPAITLTTPVTGILKGNGTSMTAALNSDLPAMTATVGGAVPTPPNNTTTFLRGDGTFATPAGGGTVTAVSVATANGFSGSSSGGATPALTIVAGAITPTSVAATGTVTGTNLSGTNTGDNAVNTLYSGLVSNATHTGDATGATALTVRGMNGVLMSGLGTGIVKNTTGTGVPSIATGADLPVMTATVGGAVPTPPNNTTTFLRGDGTFAAPAGGMTNPLTTTGDIIYGVGTTPTRLAGAPGVLKSAGAAAPAWGAVNLTTTDVTGILPVANGGTGRATWDGLLLGSGASISDISTGTPGQILRVSGTTPSWSDFAVTSADITDGTITGADLATNINITTTGNITTNAPGNLSIAGTSTLTGATTLTSLSGAGTRMVVADPSGLLSTSTVPTVGWGLSGNSGTTIGTNFIGTTDNVGLSFKTNNLQRMYINNLGQTVIDINNTNPIAAPVSNAILDIVPNGAGIGNIVLRGSFANQSDPVDIEFRNWAGATTLGKIYINPSASDMWFDANGATRLALQNDGDVGIGTTNPAQKLDVVGNVNVSSANTYMIGASTVLSNTGTGNIFVGANNGLFNTAISNTFVGQAAGRDNVGGGDNTFIGRNAGLVNTAGTLNVIVGSGAGQASTGSGNTFVGYRAGFVNTSGVRNTLIGREADVATSGLTNAIAIGYQAVAGASNTLVLGGTGANAVNVGIGTSTPHAQLQLASSVDNRKIVLYEAVDNDHEFIGFGVDGSGALRYQTAVNSNDHIFYTATSATTSSELMRITGTGRVGIGRTPTTNQLEISGNASKAAAGGWLANSDRRIKTDIRDIDNSLELIKSIRPVKYKYTEEWKRRNPSIKDQYYYSFIAQEYQKIFPEAVQGSGEYLDGDKNEILQIDTHNAQIVTIKAVQEQQKIIETQQTEIDNLKKELAEIKNYLSMEAKVVKKKKGRK